MKKGEITRQRIIELAAPLFNQHGYQGCSMQEIMAATGLEKGGIYRHFSSKEELAVEAFRFAWQKVIAAYETDLDSDISALERLQRMIERFSQRKNPIRGGCPLMNTAVDSDDGNQELRELSRQAFAGWRSRICSTVTDAQLEGSISGDADAAQLATMIVSSLEGALVLSRLDGSLQPLKYVEKSLLTVLSNLSCVSRA